MKLLVSYDLIWREGPDAAVSLKTLVDCPDVTNQKFIFKKAIHNKFKVFFGKHNTESQVPGSTYVRDDGYVFIEITGHYRVNDKDWKILKKYINIL